MAKQIIFSYEGKDYTLEYTRRTIQQMEAEGFVAEDIDKIFAGMPDKESLIGKLAEMYNEPIMSLMDEPDEKTGNVEWVTSW